MVHTYKREQFGDRRTGWNGLQFFVTDWNGGRSWVTNSTWFSGGDEGLQVKACVNLNLREISSGGQVFFNFTCVENV